MIGKGLFNIARILVTVVCLGIIIGIGVWAQSLFVDAFPEFSWNIVMYIIVFSGIAWLYYNARVEIPSEPYTVGAPTIMGRRVDGVALEGIDFLPLHPWVFDAILVDMERQTETMPKIEAVTNQDLQKIGIVISLAWTVDESKLINFLDQKDHDAVRTELSATITNKVREIALDPNEKPRNWEEAETSQSNIVSKVVAKAFGCNDPDMINRLENGVGDLEVKALGIILNRLSVENIEAPKELIDAKRKEAEEKITEDRQQREIKHESAMIKSLADENPDLDRSSILEHVQVKRGLVKKQVNESRISIQKDTLTGLAQVNNLTLVVGGGTPIAVESGSGQKGNKK